MSPDNLRHHRRSIRLPEYDYSQEGAYFVTICTQDRKCIFGEIVNGKMVLNEWGQIVDDEIIKTETLHPGVIIDTYGIMPNHVHLIILLCGDAGQGRDMARHVPTGKRPFGKPQPGSLSAIAGSIKSAVTKNINLKRSVPGGSVWQSRFFEHVIRNQKSYGNIRQYIIENPFYWDQDEENPERKTHKEIK
ncbi:MAG: transposase [bacterium]|nr:transposase [bacterium]